MDCSNIGVNESNTLTIGDGVPLSLPPEDSRLVLQKMGRELFRFMPSGEVVYDDADVDEILRTFWEWARMQGNHLDRVLAIGPTVKRDGTPGATVILHRSGDVTGERHTPDARALKLWAAIAAAWPQ
jgi:hypothetical protein